MFKNPRKYILTIVLLGFVLSSSPIAKAADGAAGWAYNAMWSAKEFGLDTAARFLARQLLSVTLKTVVDKINESGRTGRSPSFIRNWRNFLTDAQYRGEDIFRSILSNTGLCVGFGNNLRLMFKAGNNPRPVHNIRTGNFDAFDLRAKCTMPRGWTETGFRQDFSGNGGWEALSRMSEPQNNFYGSLLMALAESEAQRGLEALVDKSEGDSGSGFTGIKKSKTNPKSVCDDPPVTMGGLCLGGTCTVGGGTCTTNSQCPSQTSPSQARCTYLGMTFTPANILGQTAAKTIDTDWQWLITSDEVSEVIVAIIGAVMGRMDNFLESSNKYSKQTQITTKPPAGESDPYSECVKNFCSGLTSSGDAFGNCILQCSKDSGVPSPGTGVPPVPPAPPGPPPGPSGAIAYGVNIQANNGLYVVAEGGGGGAVNANRSVAGGWETFVLYDLNAGSLVTGDLVAIRTEFAYYFRALGGGGSGLDATATSVGGWETFTIQEQGGSGDITSGDLVSFGNGGFFMVAENGGGGVVNFNRATAGAWETFTLTILGSPPIIQPPPVPPAPPGPQPPPPGQPPGPLPN